jgi:5-(carboxyamino)imidazole ribonucleotide synthase
MAQQRTIMRERTILPGSTIGVLGGGQLGRMMALAGRAMGYRFVTLDPAEDSPCGQVADRQITAPYSDLAAAREMARLADVITYEFENVSAEVAEMLSREAYVPQGSRLLHTTQHRLREKRAVEAAGVRVAPYAEVRSLDDLQGAIGRLGLPAVLKTCTGGYDGKGQWVIRGGEEAEAAFRELSRNTEELVLEKFVNFSREISVIAARSPRGEIAVFPPAENVHVDNILHLSIVPARIGEETARQASEMASRIAEHMDVVGLIAVEMFVEPDGSLYVNELAPRPHNSGHYTMEACQTSQFEQHIRAVCNLPLGPVGLLTPVVMVNILGQHVEPVLEFFADPHASELSGRLGVAPKLHLYGKREAKKQRKMGHINLLCDDPADALQWIRETGIWQEELRKAGIEPAGK